MPKFVRVILAFLAGILTAYLIGVSLNAQFVIAAHGVPVSLGDRLNMTAFDISSMVLYLVIIAVGFFIAFLIASLLKRVLPGLASVAYPIAGAAAIGVALGLMYMKFQTVPVSGARGMFGFLAQMLAGGFGGWVFGKIGNQQAARNV